MWGAAHPPTSMARSAVSLALGPLFGILAVAAGLALGLAQDPAIMVGITVWTVTWWVLEATPIPVASLVPFVLIPATGLLSHREVAVALGSPVIILLMGAFMMSKALEAAKLHERLAHAVMRRTGAASPFRLALSFAIACAILSMWISNTATVLVMLPVAAAIATRLNAPALGVGLALTIAYSSSLGGVGTPIGTPPNAIFLAMHETITGSTVSFPEWMAVGLPIVILGIPLVAWHTSRGLTTTRVPHIPDAPPWTLYEKRVVLVFGSAILLWVTRTAPFGGWSSWTGLTQVGDATVALAAVIVMSIVPSGRDHPLLTWKAASSIPWGMLLLFAGGIAIAHGFVASGLSTLIADRLAGLSDFHPLILLGVLCLAVAFLTEITSNTATATLLMPVLGAAAIGAGYAPQTLMMPAAMCASLAFMLPVATAPNSIAYASGNVPIRMMMRRGVFLTIELSLIAALVSYFVLPLP